MSNAQYIPGAAELGRKNQPGGYAGLDANGDFVGPILNKVSTYFDLIEMLVVPDSGELAYCTDTKDLYIGDGESIGGQFLLSPSTEATLQNTEVEIKNTTGLLVCQPNLKRYCLYEFRAALAIKNNLTSSNNWQVSLTPSGNILSGGHGVIAGQLSPLTAFWFPSQTSIADRRTCDISTGFSTIEVKPSASTAVNNTVNPCLLFLHGVFTSHLNSALKLTLKQQASNALGVTLDASLTSIATRRIA